MERIVVIFSYNRPEKLRRLRAALRGQRVNRLWIFCDGPKPGAEGAVAENLAVARALAADFHSEVTVRERNLGLSASLLEGLGRVFACHESAVVLEDDVIPRPEFFDFTGRALERYAGDERIFSISGYHTIADGSRLPEVFLSPRFLCWGWASWAGRWQKIAGRLSAGEPPWRHYWQIPGELGEDARWSLRNHRLGRRPLTWGMQVAMHTYHDGQFHVCPRNILIENIGFDGSGENCPAQVSLAGTSSGGAIPLPAVLPPHLEPEPWINQAIARYFLLPPESFLKRTRRYLSYRLRARR